MEINQLIAINRLVTSCSRKVSEVQSRASRYWLIYLQLRENIVSHPDLFHHSACPDSEP